MPNSGVMGNTWGWLHQLTCSPGNLLKQVAFTSGVQGALSRVSSIMPHKALKVAKLVYDVFPPVFLSKVVSVAANHVSGVMVNVTFILDLQLQL